MADSVEGHLYIEKYSSSGFLFIEAAMDLFYKAKQLVGRRVTRAEIQLLIGNEV